MDRTSIDLFAGAGGMSEGLKACGFSPLYANDFEEPALETYAKNHPSAISTSEPIETISPGDVRKKLGLKRGELDVVVGGPPCQGFSTYGQRDLTDSRNELYRQFIGFIEEFQPKSFIMENVIGILSMNDGAVVQAIKKDMESHGYGVNLVTLDAAEFGVPQYRRRVFFLGGRNGGTIPTPMPTHYSPRSSYQPSEQGLLWEDKLSPAVSVREAISDLPKSALLPSATHESIPHPTGKKRLTSYQEEMRDGTSAFLHHSSKQMLGIRRLRVALLRPGDYGTQLKKRISESGLPDTVIDELLGGTGLADVTKCRKQDREKESKLRELLHQGHVDIEEVLKSLDSKGFANKYRRLEWDEPSHTLVAHMARDCSDFVHPEIDRFISVREAARLQSFPDRYIFCGSQFRQFRQIGNAVPPKLACAVGRSVCQFLDQLTESKRKLTKASA